MLENLRFANDIEGSREEIASLTMQLELLNDIDVYCLRIIYTFMIIYM